LAATSPVPVPEVGDLVVCHDATFRETMRLPAEPGLVVDLRRDQGKVFFPVILGEAWIPHHELSRVKHPGSAPGIAPWMQRVWFLSRTLGAIRLQVERFGPEGNAVRIFHEEIEVERIDAVREGLGEELRYYAIAPAGLHKMEANIAFVTVPREAPLPRPAPGDPR